jgi:peptidoglycan/LPS O-acetylase OafA/YrhL
MQSSSLKFVIVLLVAGYALAGFASAHQLRAEMAPQAYWGTLAAFWAFLAVSLLRLSVTARTISVALLWSVVLLFSLCALEPSSVSELAEVLGMAELQTRRVSNACIALSAFGALRVLAKHKAVFR